MLSAIAASGWNVVPLGNAEAHPFRLRAVRDDTDVLVRVYIWNITHGGGHRAAEEYRIQVTSIESFQLEPGGATLVLGWWGDAEVYAAFDVGKHLEQAVASQSIQIHEETMRHAYERGIATQTKGNEEVAVAFRPDLFMHYVQNMASLHGFGESDHDAAVLKTVAADPYAVTDDEIGSVAQQR